MVDKIDTKGWAYKEGRRAGAANRPRSDNPCSNAVGEWSDWDTGWLDGYTDIGWSKSPKPSLKKPGGK